MSQRILSCLLALFLAYPARASMQTESPDLAEGTSQPEEIRRPPSIDHQPVGCAVAEKFSRFGAHFLPADDIGRAQVLFQGDIRGEWYAVAMKSEGPVFFAVLPKPKRSLKAFRYYIEVTDKALRTTRTPEYTTSVVDSSGACAGKVMAVTLGSASVLLFGPAGAATIPGGFLSTGVVAASTAGAAGVAGAAAGGGGGLSTGAIAGIAGGLGAVVVGALLATKAQDADSDGVTAKDGDCDDHNAAVGPKGTLQLSNARFETTSVACPLGATNQAHAPYVILFDGLNNSCSVGSISSLSARLTVVAKFGTSNIVGEFGISTPPFSPNSVAAAGGQQTFRVTIGGRCTNGNSPSPALFTDYSGQLTIGSSSGQVVLTTTNNFRLTF